jgi:iron(III) transport system permease protein
MSGLAFRLRWREDLPWSLGVLAWCAVVAAPILVLVASLGQEPEALWRAAWPDARRLRLLTNSILMALAVAAACVALSVPAAAWLLRRKGGRFAVLIWLPLLMVAIPPYVHALAWMEFWRGIDGGLALLGLSLRPFPLWLKAVWVAAAAHLPISLAFSMIGLANNDPRLSDAARIFVDEWSVFRRIRLVLALPTILVGGGFVFLMSLADFSVPSLFQVHVYAMEIFVEHSTGNGQAATLAVALPLVLVGLAVVPLISRGMQHMGLVPERFGRITDADHAIGPGFARLQAAAAVGVCLLIGVPIAVLIVSVGAPATFTEALVQGGSAVVYSVLVALGAAVTTTMLALTLVRRTLDRRWMPAILLPLAVPASLIGIGLIAVWNHGATEFVFHSILMPVLASSARFAPIAAATFLVYSRSISPDLLEAAEVLQGRGAATWWQVYRPLFAPGIATAFLVVFALSLGELPATLMVAQPGQQTLALRVYNLLHYGASDQVAALCLLLTGLSVVPLGLAVLAGRPRGRKAPAAGEGRPC